MPPAAEIGRSPYTAELNAVSVGSMLFDLEFFRSAGKQFPDVHFHVIGSGERSKELTKNVHFYDEMSFRSTLPFIKSATFGIAPYRKANVPYYLCDTSMKIMQYEYFQLPVVCPDFAVGDGNSLRIGYTPADDESIFRAIQTALVGVPSPVRTFLTWREVADRILEPGSYADTQL